MNTTLTCEQAYSLFLNTVLPTFTVNDLELENMKGLVKQPQLSERHASAKAATLL